MYLKTSSPPNGICKVSSYLVFIVILIMFQSLEKRMIIIDEIRKELENKIGNLIQSATVYWSTLCEDFCETSDYDILLILYSTEYNDMKKIKEIKENFKNKNINIDFNVHKISETPSIRKKLYRHNNRSIYFQKEIELYGKRIIGTSPFQTNISSLWEIRKEAIRVINSILYQARKLLINRELSQGERINMMKFCIYVTLYALAAKNIYPKTKQEALNIFKKHFITKYDPLIFLEAKTKHPNSISDNYIKMSYDFISSVDEIIYGLYWW